MNALRILAHAPQLGIYMAGDTYLLVQSPLDSASIARSSIPDAYVFLWLCCGEFLCSYELHRPFLVSLEQAYLIG